jgi:hypothetical protein
MKKCIYSIAQDEGIIEDHDNLKSYVTNYYKNLLRTRDEGNFSMDEN